MNLVVLLAALGLVLWIGRRIPLAGWRKRLTIGCRLAAIGALGAALAGASHHRPVEVPRNLLYLVDGSASIDALQREWVARRIASLEAIRPQEVERAVVMFGGEAHVVFPFGQERLTDQEMIRQALENTRVSPGQTNLEAALLSVTGLLPPHHHGSVVLLSDGRETTGHVTSVLAVVKRLGMEVFPAPPPVFGEAKTVWEELAVPPIVQRGAPVSVQLVVFNGTSRVKRGQVTIALQGVSIKRQRVAVRPGWQVFSLAVPAIGHRAIALDVHLAIPEEGLTEHRRAYTEVEGPAQLLLVTDRTSVLPALATALKRREMGVAVTRPEDLPMAVVPPSEGEGGRLNRLLDYDAIMLFNVPKSSLAVSQVEALRTYVEEFGGGLLMVGLGGDLAYEIETPSPLDPLLPVQFEPKGLREAQRRVCIILLIDRSASMLGPRIAATKRAAVALVKQLSPEDLVGILAFDTQPYVVAEVQPAGQIGSWLVDKLVKLRSSGGTDVYPALTASADRLELTGATLKHIILLSDGNTPFHRQAYEALIESLKLDGTTVSTVGIGSAFINTEYLEWLAKSTGGTFYQMRTLDELPQLIARDAEQALGRLPFTEGRFRPSKDPTTDWFSDTSDWPTLRGYLTATARPGARVDLTVNGGGGDDPLLARWSVGQGRVVSFTSDGDTRWSPEWVRWPGFEGAWAQVVRWTMRPRLTEELFVWVDETGNTPQLVVEGTLHDPHGELIAAEGVEALPLALVQTGAWRWHASLEQVPSGWYQLALESHLPIPSRNDEGPTGRHPDSPEVESPLFAKRWVEVGTPPTSHEMTGQPPRESLLRQIARSTSGAYDAPDRALLAPTTTVTVTEPLFVWWLPLVIAALLADIALRGSSML